MSWVVGRAANAALAAGNAAAECPPPQDNSRAGNIVLYEKDDVSGVDVVNAADPLGWRFKATRVYSHVVILARTYVAVRASSTASERVPRSSGLFATETCYHLIEDRLTYIVFLHESLKHYL